MTLRDRFRRRGQGHDNISTFAAAYALGKQESTAAVFLMQRVPTFVKESLVALVRPCLVDCTWCEIRYSLDYLDDKTY